MITFRVSAKHIQDGVPGSPSLCPVARALSEHTGEAWSAFSHTLCSSKYLIQPSMELRQFMRDFDRGLPVEPTEFTLEDPWLITDSREKP